MNQSVHNFPPQMSLAAVLRAAARELGAQHENCALIERALSKLECEDGGQANYDFEMLQMLDSHTQVIADLSKFLAALADAADTPGRVDPGAAFTAIQLDSLRYRLRRIDGSDMDPAAVEDELF